LRQKNTKSYIFENAANPAEKLRLHFTLRCILYNYALIIPFHIYCQNEVNWPWLRTSQES